MSNYRVADAEPIQVVRYTASSMFAKIAVAMFMGVFACGSLYGVGYYARTLTLSCTRHSPTTSSGGGSCVIDSSLVFHAREEIPLDQIGSTQLVPVQNKSTVTYRIALNLASGVRMIGRDDSEAPRRQQYQALDSFLHDRSQSSISIDVDNVKPFGVAGLGAVTLLMIVLAWTQFGHTVLKFDFAQSRVLIVRYRWPLRQSRQSEPLDAIASAEVGSRSGGKGGTYYFVELVTQHGTKISLGNDASTSRKRSDAAAAAIHRILKKWRAR